MTDLSQKEFLSKINPNFLEIYDLITKTIESVNENLGCDIKWGRLTYGLKGDYHHWICSIEQTKKSLNLIFHFGGILNDENKIFIAGNSFFLRKLKYTSIYDVDAETIKDFVRQAIEKLDYFKENWKSLSNKTK